MSHAGFRAAGSATATLVLVLAGAVGTSAGSAAAPAAPIAVSSPATGLSLSGLEVEKKSEPVGIDMDRPRFSWIIESDARGVEQRSFRLRLATSDGALDSGDLVWDSGVVASAESANVEYTGPQLESTTRYVWSVEVVTNVGSVSSGSEFRTGFFSEADWPESAWIGNARIAEGTDQLTLSGAHWIWTPEATTPVAPAEPRAFRSTRDTPAGKVAQNAEVLITADDSFRLWVNGEFVDGTAGAENEWQQSHLHRVNLEADRNVFAVRTNNGGGSPAGLVAKVRVNYADGTNSTFTTDTDWKASKTFPDNFFEPGFDDSAWGLAVRQAAYGSGPWGSGVRPPKTEVKPAPLLRKEFDVAGDVRNATVYVAAGGYANVSLNGSPISDDVLSPGFTDYDDTVQYAATDITDQLEPGQNALGVELGRGFYGMTGGNVWRWESPPWHDDPVVKAVLHIEYADGSTDDVVTDDSWRIHDGPTVFDDLYGGEMFDAGKVQTGFDTTGFDDAGWAAASEVHGPKGVLVNQRQQPIRVTESLPAVQITEPVADTYVVKFPRVLAGWVEFTAKGAAGTTIRAQYGEKLKADGLPNFSNNGGFASGFQTDRFILAGTGSPESWESRFSYKGFQYIQVTGWPGDDAPPLDAFTAKAVHTDAPESGSFDSSSDIMNRTHRAVVDTLANNIHGIPTDTPMFEKNGWTGDAAVGAEMFMLNLDVHELFAKWMRDVHETRDAEGAPMVIAPSSGNWGEWGVAPPWHSAYILIPWWLYQYGGDRRVLEQQYDGMKQYVDLEFGRAPGGIVANPRLGDWVSPEASPAGSNAPEDIRLSGTAFLYVMITSMQKTAKLLGRAADAAHFADQAATVRAAFNSTFLDQVRGLYRGNANDRGYRQTHNVLALAFGLAPDAAMAQRVADSIAADVVAKGTHLNTGALGTKYLLPVLTKYGHEDLAYALAVQTTYPSWGYMVENDGTTMWEHWSLEARSRGHYFLGTVDDWFFKDVAGIQASETTGYRDLTIAPAVTGKMDWAKASTDTPFGPVSTDWASGGGKLRLDVSVPVGSTATVHVPAQDKWAVYESGKPVEDADGVKDVRVEDGAVLVEVGSGDYSFEADEKIGKVGAVIDLLDATKASIDELRAAGSLSGGQAKQLSSYVASARATALKAIASLRSGNVINAAQELAAALSALDDFDALVRVWPISVATRSALSYASTSVRNAVYETVSDFLEVDAEVALDGAGTKPGGVATAKVGVTNSGATTIRNVRGEITGLSPAWAVDPNRAVLSRSLVGGKSAEASFDITVPADQKPGTKAASAEITYLFAGQVIRVVEPFEIEVDSPIVVESVSVDPATVRPGRTAVVTTKVRNDGAAASMGHVEVAVPEGWTTPAAGDELQLDPGEVATVNTTVSVPRDARQAVTDVELVATFASGDAVLATGRTTLRVEIDPTPPSVEGYDHIDLGNGISEVAHALTSSPSSGTSTEAGLTRRYAGHLTPFSFFEFDLAVRANEAFVLRVVETYDRAQTKRYKIYVDGKEVALRTFNHSSGAGTETYELVVPAEFATSSKVRVKFENQDDPAYYDPSIADVWSLPVG